MTRVPPSTDFNDLSDARTYLRRAQGILHRARVSGVYDRTQLHVFEQHVLAALTWVWEAQCRFVFEDHGDGFFDSDSCRAYVNGVDWHHSYSGVIFSSAEPVSHIHVAPRA